MPLRLSSFACLLPMLFVIACGLDIGNGSQLTGQRCFQESDCSAGLTCLERVCVPVVQAGGGELDAGAIPDGGESPDGGANNQNNENNDQNNNNENNDESCQLGARRCVSDQTLQVCIDVGDRNEYRETRCAADRVCRDGRCVDADGCVDRDGDGFGSGCAAGDDCNDDDPLIHPGRPEDCSTPYDDNCDGRINEGCMTTECCPNGCGNGEFCTTTCACEPYDPLVCQRQNQPCAQEGAFFNDFYCVSIDGVTEPRCWGVCEWDAADPSATCPDANSVCAFGSDGMTGFCFGVCSFDATGSSGCPGDLGCTHLDVDLGAGICTPKNDENGPGDRCNLDSFWDCSEGYVCVDMQGDGIGRCEQACRPFAHGVAGTATDCSVGHCLPFGATLGICSPDNMASAAGETCAPSLTMCGDDALTCYPNGFGNAGTCYRACRLADGAADCVLGWRCSSQFDPSSDIGICTPG